MGRVVGASDQVVHRAGLGKQPTQSGPNLEHLQQLPTYARIVIGILGATHRKKSVSHMIHPMNPVVVTQELFEIASEPHVF